uniref:Reverse transcriptase domain-containing protein n=1 Tax=Rhizophagus irregularis (strain DAOM 181602 / DAOM 197198 / MUCL 43194) TaxID=747089 RepID=U9U8Y3_RHIID
MSNFFKQTQTVPFELRPFIHLSHKLDHYISSLLKEFIDLFPDQTALIDAFPLPTTLYSQAAMKAAIAERNSNFMKTKKIYSKLFESHFQDVVGPSRSPFKTLENLPDRWKSHYILLTSIDSDIYLMVMAPITEDELRAVINISLHHKAPGPSCIPYEWFRLLSPEGLLYLCKLMNSCLASSDIPKDWCLASIVPIPKPHEFECLLNNTCPITLLETAQKLLVKIVTDRLSQVMAKYQVLTGDNFAGLPGSSVNTPINILNGIMKSHRVSQLPQELWILSQDISKVKNRILTPFGKTELYNLLIGIDQGKVISPLLWTIYFDLLLTELSSSAISSYIWSSGIPADILDINNNEDVAVPITQLTYMDDFTLIASSLSGLKQLLPIARDFYFLNNITANFSKYKLVSSSAGNNLITFQLDFEILDYLSSMSFSLQTLKLSSSFRFLGVWFNLQGSPNFVLSQLKDIYSSFVTSVRFKKLSPAQLAYLHSLVILPKVQFHFQVLYLSEIQIMRITNGYYGLQCKALSVAHTFPLIALISRFFSKDVNPYDSLCKRLICHFLSWISLLSTTPNRQIRSLLCYELCSLP